MRQTGGSDGHLENNQYAWFVVLFLQTATPWFINACEVSLISDSSYIVTEAEGTERERRRGGRMKKLDWWPIRGGRGGVSFLYVEEGGRRLGSRECPGPYPEVMEINLLLLSNGYKIRLSTGLHFYRTRFSPE